MFCTDVLYAVAQFLSQRHVNATITALIIFASSYIFLTSVLHVDPLDPLDRSRSFPEPQPLPLTGNVSRDAVLEVTTMSTAVIRKSVDPVVSILALFLLLVMALVCGQICEYVRLPPLLGMMLAGVLVRNYAPLAAYFHVDAEFDYVLRRVAFVLILMRCAVNLEPHVIRQSGLAMLALGVLTTTAETAAILCTAHFLVGLSWPLSILFALVLASTSPAVTVPSMIRLQEQGRGTRSGIPTVLLAAASIDNILCVSAYGVAAAVLQQLNGDLLHLSLKTVVELAIALVSCAMFGIILRLFPRTGQPNTHFHRTAALCAVSGAVLFGTKRLDVEMMGPIVVFGMCMVAAWRWKSDNPEGTTPEEKFLKYAWNFLFQPFLFALIGLLFDFSELNSEILLKALIVISIGVACRIVVAFIVALPMHCRFKEKIFISFCFFPKATVQAALAPALLELALDATPAQSRLAFQVCVLSILATAPLGQLLIDLLGRCLLEQDVFTSSSTIQKEKVRSTSLDEFDHRRSTESEF